MPKIICYSSSLIFFFEDASCLPLDHFISPQTSKDGILKAPTCHFSCSLFDSMAQTSHPECSHHTYAQLIKLLIMKEIYLFVRTTMNGTFFNSVKSVSSLLKTGYCKREEFASLRSKFFLFRVDPFQKTIGMQEIKQKITKIISLLKLQNIDQVYQFTLKTAS